jgi:putative tricarboxylic transport membrane protein
VPSQVLLPILVLMLALGAYSLRGYYADVVITFTFGLIGHAFRRHQFSLIALMIGLFLGSQLDANIVRFVILYGDDPLALIERPISLVLMVLSLGMLIWQIVQYRRTGV